MIPAPFDYTAPESLADAIAALGGDAEEIKVLAGGQSLIPVLKLRLAAPTLMVDLGKIDELKGISDDGDAIVIGAMTTHDEVAASSLVAEHASVLAKAAQTVADPQVRHRGTLGGALVARRPGRRPAGADPGARRRAGDRGCRRRANRRRGGLLRGPLHHRGRRGRDPHADPDPQAHRLGRALREVHPRRAAVVDRRALRPRSRPTAARSREAKIGLTNMGSTAMRATGVEAALVGQPASAEAVKAACCGGGRGHEPADRHQRRRRLPSSPGDGVLTGRAVLAAAGG